MTKLFSRRFISAGLMAVTFMAGAVSAAEPQWRKITGDGAPAARHESAAAYLDGRIYLIGGRGDRPLDIHDVKTGKWSTGARLSAEMNHMQAVTHGGKIFVIGALTGPWPEEAVISHVQIYDPQSDTWSEGAEIPADRRRGGGGVAVHDGLLYLIGGNRRGHNSGFVPWIDSFNPATGEWKRLPDAPRPRDHFHAVALEGKIYAAGGRKSSTDTGQPMDLTVGEVDVYDIAAAKWATVAAIPTQRAGASAIARNGEVVVIGGESGVQVPGHAEVEAFDPATGAWRALTPLPVGRHGFQAITVDGDIHVIAGSGNRGGGPELSDHWVLAK